MEEVVQTAQSTVAILLVATYAWFRFNTPPTARSETTWTKFFIGRAIYVAIILSALLALLSSPALIELLIDQIWPDADTEALHQELAVPLIAALLLTVFLSEVPVLSKADRQLRAYFHWIAAIPKERRERSRDLKQSRLAVPDEIKTEVLGKLESQGLRESDLDPENEDRKESAETLWTRLTVHAVCLDKLRDDQKYKSELSKPEFREFRVSYDRIAEKAQHAFPLIRQRPDEKANKLLRQELTEQIQNLLAGLYDLLSRMILNCERTERKRRACIKRLGLEPATKKDSLPIHEFLWLLVLLMLAFTIAVESVGGSIEMVNVVSISLTLVTAVAMALLVHPQEDGDEDLRVPPIGRYLLAGALAFVAWLTLRGTAELLHTGEFILLVKGQHSDALTTFVATSWPWSFIPVTIAVVVSALTDDWIERRLGATRKKFDLGRFLNLLDAVILAVATGACGYVLVFGQLSDPPTEHAWQIGLVAAVIGFVIGLLVPCAYRRRSTMPAVGRKRILEQEEQDLQTTG